MVQSIVKQLACMEDLACGVGPVQQDRGGSPVEVGKIDLAYAVVNLVVLAELDVDKYTLASHKETRYRYDASATTGQVKSSTGPGWWLYEELKLNTVITKPSPNSLGPVLYATATQVGVIWPDGTDQVIITKP